MVVGIPSNDFGRQEAGSEQEIKKFCEVNFGVDFPLMAKQRVTGSQAHPLYRWMVEELGVQNAPRWNFHKYLIAPDGRVIATWPSNVLPLAAEIVRSIETWLDSR